MKFNNFILASSKSVIANAVKQSKLFQSSAAVDSLAITMVAIMMFSATAFAQNDGWNKEYSSMNYDTLYISDSAGAAQGNYFVRTKFLGDDISDQVIWGRKFNSAVPFQRTLKLSSRTYGNSIGCWPIFKVIFYHVDAAISSDFVLAGDGHWNNPVYGPGTWSSNLSSFDSLSIVVAIGGWSTAYIGGVDVDNFRVTLGGVDSLFYTAGDWGDISGTVWHDTLLNSIKEPQEPGLAGWTVFLSGTTYDTVVTDSNGYYYFSQLSPGSYEVSLELLPNWEQVYPLSSHSVELNPFATLSHYNVDFGATIQDAIKIPINKGWNMVSVPLILPSLAKAVLFPSATSDAFWYNGSSYEGKDTLELGQGYWLKFNREQYLFMAGDSINQDSIEVVEGWNMIGALSAPVLIGEITSQPPGMITSQFFGHYASYQPVDTLHPGRGYWVKTELVGKLYLNAAEGLAKNSSRIIIVNTNGLPPPPPGESTSITPVPSRFDLLQNYPNPFNPSTKISYQLPTDGWVTLKVYNILGQEVKNLIDENQNAGFKSAEWDASGIPTGVYFYRLQTKDYIETKKLILIR